jgi:hypothetical protein
MKYMRELPKGCCQSLIRERKKKNQRKKENSVVPYP